MTQVTPPLNVLTSLAQNKIAILLNTSQSVNSERKTTDEAMQLFYTQALKHALSNRPTRDQEKKMNDREKAIHFVGKILEFLGQKKLFGKGINNLTQDVEGAKELATKMIDLSIEEARKLDHKA